MAKAGVLEAGPEPDGPDRSPHALYAAALDAVAHGLCVFDAELRVALFNQPLLDLLGFSRDIIRIGLPLRDLLRYATELGNFAGLDFEDIWRDRTERLGRRQAFSARQVLTNGRVVTIGYRPAINGGWVVTVEDVTEQHRLDGELNEQVARFRLALDTMSGGIAMYGADERLLVCNRQYIACFNFDPAVVKPGISLFELARHCLERGLYTGIPVEELYREARGRLDSGGN
ncbi:MAG TPA: PAS-domain containing protein, partial [Roseomonas sp.]